MPLLNTIGLALIDAGLQAAQLGTLTSPFALPTQEAYYLTLQLWLTNESMSAGSRRVRPLMTHTFAVMPQQMQILKSYLARVVNTPGGSFVEDFTLPDDRVLAPYPVTFSGNFGKKARLFRPGRAHQFTGSVDQLVPISLPADLVSGYGQTKFLERLCDLSHYPPQQLYDEYSNSLNPFALVEAGFMLSGDIGTELVLYNWTFHQFVTVVVNNVTFSRNAQLNCWTYQIKMTALRNAVESPTQPVSMYTQLLGNMLMTAAQATFDSATKLINAPRGGGNLLLG